MPKPLISILINNYNYADFVGRAIESALQQSRDLCEVIVVDDGSTDASREVISSYGAQIKCIIKPNGGQASAFNAGFAAARGEVIVFLDSDDLLLPGAVEELANQYAEDAEWVKTVWQMQEIGPGGENRSSFTPNHPPDEGYLLAEVVERGPLAVNSAPTSGNAWRRSFLDQVMPVPEAEYLRGADGYLLMLAPLYGRILRVDRPLSCYRVHGTNFLASQSEFEKMETLKRRDIHARRFLASHLEKLGIGYDASTWKHSHWDQLSRLAGELQTSIPPEASIILVDGDALNVGRSLYGRSRRHLMEKGGTYYGPPDTAADAIAQIRDHHARGARYLAFVWYTFWWLEFYGELTEWLALNASDINHSPQSRIYRLNEDLR